MVTRTPRFPSHAVYGILPLLLVPLLMEAQTFFVATTGNDSGPGTELQPWRTIQKACTAATPGSTVFIRGGIYNEKVTLSVSGNATNGFVTFRNVEGETAILDGAGIAGKISCCSPGGTTCGSSA